MVRNNARRDLLNFSYGYNARRKEEMKKTRIARTPTMKIVTVIVQNGMDMRLGIWSSLRISLAMLERTWPQGLQDRQRMEGCLRSELRSSWTRQGRLGQNQFPKRMQRRRSSKRPQGSVEYHQPNSQPRLIWKKEMLVYHAMMHWLLKANTLLSYR